MERPLLAKLSEQLGPASLYREALDGELPIGELLTEMSAALGYKPLPEPAPSPPPSWPAQSPPALSPLLDNANSASVPPALPASTLAALAGVAGGEAAGCQPPSGSGSAALQVPQHRPQLLQPGAASHAGQKRSFMELLASPAGAATAAAAAVVAASPQPIASPQTLQAAAHMRGKRPPLAPGMKRTGSLPAGRAPMASSPQLRRSASAAQAPAATAALPGPWHFASAAGMRFLQPQARQPAEAAVLLQLHRRRLDEQAAQQAKKMLADRPLASGLQDSAAAFLRLRPRASSSLTWRLTHLACRPDTPAIDAARALAEGLSAQHPQRHPAWVSVRLWLCGPAAAPGSSAELAGGGSYSTRELAGPETIRSLLDALPASSSSTELVLEYEATFVTLQAAQAEAAAPAAQVAVPEAAAEAAAEADADAATTAASAAEGDAPAPSPGVELPERVEPAPPAVGVPRSAAEEKQDRDATRVAAAVEDPGPTTAPVAAAQQEQAAAGSASQGMHEEADLVPADLTVWPELLSLLVAEGMLRPDVPAPAEATGAPVGAQPPKPALASNQEMAAATGATTSEPASPSESRQQGGQEELRWWQRAVAGTLGTMGQQERHGGQHQWEQRQQQQGEAAVQHMEGSVHPARSESPSWEPSADT
ncbi:hypothetical protein ABPG77_004841 [Micractinium sp. CCAP 211/92]